MPTDPVSPPTDPTQQDVPPPSSEEEPRLSSGQQKRPRYQTSAAGEAYSDEGSFTSGRERSTAPVMLPLPWFARDGLQYEDILNAGRQFPRFETKQEAGSCIATAINQMAQYAVVMEERVAKAELREAEVRRVANVALLESETRAEEAERRVDELDLLVQEAESRADVAEEKVDQRSLCRELARVQSENEAYAAESARLRRELERMQRASR